MPDIQATQGIFQDRNKGKERDAQEQVVGVGNERRWLLPHLLIEGMEIG